MGLASGFADPVIDAARLFRTVLEAMARPGRVFRIAAAPAAPEPLSPAAAAVALTLVDGDARAWLAPGLRGDAVDAFLRFHTSAAPVAEAAKAAFAFGTWGEFDGIGFPLGSPEYPDRSTTLVIEAPRLLAGHGVRLTGPGIETEHRLDAGLPAGFWAMRAEYHSIFPMGRDVILTCGDCIAALPRTTVSES